MDPARALPLNLALRVGPGALAAAAAAAGAGYALVAYSLGPETLPLSVVVGIAIAFGIWRLEWGIALFLLALPFAENLESARLEDTPLRSALIFWLGAIVIVQAARVVVQRRRITAPRMLWPIAGFVAAALVGLALAPAAGSAAKFLTIAGGAVLFLMIASFVEDLDRLRPILLALVVGALVVSAHAIWQYQTGQFGTAGFVTDSGDVEFRISSTFSSPNPLAGFLVVMVPVGVGLIRLSRRRWVRTLAVSLVLLAIVATVLTFSRGALVALAALPLIYIRDWRAWPFVAVAVVAMALLAPSTWQARVSNVTDTSSTEVATRLDFWRSALVTFDKHPITGSGLDTFADEYLQQKRAGRTFLGGSGSLTPPQTAHNLYLNTLAELGLVGAVALAILVVSAFRLGLALRASSDRVASAIGLAVLGATLVFFAHNLFDVTLLDPKNALQIFALLGVGAAAWRAQQETRHE